MKATKSPPMLTVPQIKSRGWTPTAIKKFLPAEPDDAIPNPKYPHSAAPMKLWLRRRVLRAERTKAFLAWKEGVEKRKDAAQKAVQTRMEYMERSVIEAEIVVVAGYTNKEIHGLASKNPGGNYQGRTSAFCWSKRSAINCIRHNLTNYEDLWALINHGDTAEYAYKELRERIDEAVDVAYSRFIIAADDTPPPIDESVQPLPSESEWPEGVRYVLRDISDPVK